MAEKKSQNDSEPLIYNGRQIKNCFSLSVEEAELILESVEAEEEIEMVRCVAEERLALLEKCSEQMIEGWSIKAVNDFRKLHKLTRAQMKHLEADARKVLADSFTGVQRQDLVARQLHRLELIAQSAMETNAHSTAQACVTTVLKVTGCDRPEE